ncbi:hypothetical protein PBI_SUZY_88 [Gordonia phage Suzy]|uniref:Uncharacterized protein n=1 Tax=Gordonia phage Suzy TaxID=2201430 RepID=A0A2Z4Q815_9CAUD|nr:hypothetical protein HOT44_gp88 [Gordonia phage Suzy]AWY06192.1 hypothetical protein PBI_SUZY_88 [Gordonia phage Suzy]
MRYTDTARRTLEEQFEQAKLLKENLGVAKKEASKKYDNAVREVDALYYALEKLNAYVPPPAQPVEVGDPDDQA